MAEAEPSIRIKSINVIGLFGLYDHRVTLNSERVTVIHGPNGVGKTVFLKLTHAFLKRRYNEIVKIPFRQFEILFDDETVARIASDEEGGTQRKFKITVERAGHQPEIVTIDGELLNTHRLANQISEASPFLHQVGPDEWVDRRTEEVFSADELVARADEFTPKEAKKWASREPKSLRELKARINVHFIEAQRLIRVMPFGQEWRYRAASDRTTTATVQEYAKDLKRKLETALASWTKPLRGANPRHSPDAIYAAYLTPSIPTE